MLASFIKRSCLGDKYIFCTLFILPAIIFWSNFYKNLNQNAAMMKVFYFASIHFSGKKSYKFFPNIIASDNFSIPDSSAMTK